MPRAFRKKKKKGLLVVNGLPFSQEPQCCTIPSIRRFWFGGGGVKIVLIWSWLCRNVSGKPLNSDAAATSCTSRPTGPVQKGFTAVRFRRRTAAADLCSVNVNEAGSVAEPAKSTSFYSLVFRCGANAAPRRPSSAEEDGVRPRSLRELKHF